LVAIKIIGRWAISCHHDEFAIRREFFEYVVLAATPKR